MHKVLIATQSICWGALALSICSCNANSQSKLDSQSVPPQETLTATATPNDIPRSTPIITSSPTISPAPQVVTAKPAALVEVPYVNPLNAIPLAAKQQVANSNSDTPPVDRLTKQPTSDLTPNSNLPSAACRSFPCLILSQDSDRALNKFNNPVYKLTAYRDRTANYIFQFDAVTGRGFTQSKNRYKSNTEAPLPDGSYAIAARVVKGTIAEVGGTMVPIFPKPGFDRRMRRTALGIHWDPSFEKDAKEDGTSGCIGLTSKQHYYQVKNFVLKYRPRSLEVQIDR
ncbi:hypothetical protein [Chamaesiphon sp. VAR_48_metabat_403]|uniref:hypothetical protein n=1 Tax=Chamaesiphon sp. VAR_48_metabat_403 TaxID=2964700 RepID=UPI00286D7470|nr:hypothetical protein [Chamaesiphon sp. VAR_48_metabat_403]